jgi:transposase-like protein
VEEISPMPALVSRSPFKAPRWTESQAREVIAAQKRSGKSVSRFAAEHGLDPQRLYLWRRRLAAVAESDNTTFRELIVRPSATVSIAESKNASFEVVLASGILVRVPASFDAVALVRLLDALGQARAC